MFVTIVSALLSGMTVLLQVALVVFFIMLLTKDKLTNKLKKHVTTNATFYAAVIATVALVGSLFYSEVAGYRPCLLCWYQRIVIFPQALILWVAHKKKDKNVRNYSLPLAFISLIISGYHYLLQLFPPEAGSTLCGFDSSCIGRYIYEFGHVTIAGMAFTVSVAIIALMLLGTAKKKTVKKKKGKK